MAKTTTIGPFGDNPITGCQKCGQNATSQGCYCRDDTKAAPEVEALKPCPFCESKDIDSSFAMGKTHVAAGCFNCGAIGPDAEGQDNEAEAIKLWNTRATSTLRQVLLEVLEEFAKWRGKGGIEYETLRRVIIDKLEG